jgi:protein-S-isoprenylcysteine O-methyltransferase Ste14
MCPLIPLVLPWGYRSGCSKLRPEGDSKSSDEQNHEPCRPCMADDPASSSGGPGPALTVAVIVPAVLLHDAGTVHPAARWGGALLIIVGLAATAGSVRLFAVRGRGTLAPWDPPRRLVVSGLYRYVRNPMISGAALVLTGECLLFASREVAAWTAALVAINAVYMPLIEEPRLARRFGPPYEEYRRHVPGWVPRLTPWHGGSRDS